VHNIRDFILLHFVCPRRDTEFWRKLADVKLPESLENNLKVWKDKLPIEDDFPGSGRQLLFRASHFLLVLHGLKIFNIDSITTEFNSIPINLQKDAENTISYLENGNRIDQPDILTHKEMLTIIRDNT